MEVEVKVLELELSFARESALRSYNGLIGGVALMRLGVSGSVGETGRRRV